MLYLSVLFLIGLFVIRFDILERKKGFNTAYRLTLAILVLLCAFEYNVGSDDLVYRDNFDSLISGNFKTILLGSLDGDTRYMPGWVLLSYGVKYTFDSYFVIKLIQALFVNCVVFKLIKEKAALPFTAVLLYVIFDYLLINFNIVRQSFAFAFFILAYLSYDKGKLLKFYVYVTFAVMFHNTAFLLYFVPFFGLLKINNKTITLYICAVIGFMIYFTRYGDIAGLFSLVGKNASMSLSHSIDTYSLSYNGGVKDIVKYSMTFLITLALDIFVIVRAYKRDDRTRILPFVICYLMAVLIQQLLPILFRYRTYFDLFMIVILTNEMYEMMKKQKAGLKLCITSFCLLVFSYTTVKGYLKSVDNETPYIYQYYPYTSIFSDEFYVR